MPVRAVLAIAFAVLCLGGGPALAAPTDQQKFEKRMARFAQPAASVDFAKARGLCTCGLDDPVSIEGQTGVLVYDFQPGLMAVAPRVICQIPIFDLNGALTVTQNCVGWTLLSR